MIIDYVHTAEINLVLDQSQIHALNVIKHIINPLKMM